MVAQGLQRGTPARRDVSPFIPWGYDNFGKLSKTWRNKGPLGLQNADNYDRIHVYKNDTLKGKKMSYTMMFKIREERTQKSLAAYEKYVAKNGDPTDTDMRKLFDRFDEFAKKGPGLYWWAVKVYNGWCIVNKKDRIWS